MRSNNRYALFLIGALASWPAAAHAHPAQASFRLGLGVPAFAVTHYPAPNHTTVNYALAPIIFGVHFGVQVTHEIGLSVVVLGGGVWDNTPAGDANIVYFSSVPRFEYMFTPHGTVGFYLGAEIGIDIFGDTRTNLRDVFRTGGLFGMHIFAETEFSVDLELAPDFLYDVDLGAAGFRGTFYVSTTGWMRI